MHMNIQPLCHRLYISILPFVVVVFNILYCRCCSLSLMSVPNSFIHNVDRMSDSKQRNRMHSMYSMHLILSLVLVAITSSRRCIERVEHNIENHQVNGKQVKTPNEKKKKKERNRQRKRQQRRRRR